MTNKTKLKQSRFYRLHPYISFFYFVIVLLLTMLSMHPVIMIISFITAFTYSCYLGGRKQFWGNLKLLPVALIFCLINPLVNHQGVTILFYFNDNPVTKEAILFGLMSGLMFYDIMLTFQIFNQMITEDKIICVVSHIFPFASLILTMAFRFVPMYKKQYQNMQKAQKCIGQDSVSGNPVKRMVNFVIGISALITWCLENAIETSNSMKARGFHSGKRTYYQNIIFTRLDRCYFLIELGLTGILFYAIFNSFFTIHYYPNIILVKSPMESIFFYLVFFLFSLFPLIIDVKEDFLWHISKRNI